MPPRRKAAATASAALRARAATAPFGKSSVVSKSVGASVKAAAIKRGILSNAEVKTAGDDAKESIAVPVAQQQGDEDVSIVQKAQRPSVKVNPEPAAASPVKKKRKRGPIDDLFSPPTKKPSQLSPPTPPPASPPRASSETLPPDLLLLQTLHSSLLTALLLHKAHHNNSTHPASFSAIKLHVERLARRNITFDDLRRIVYLSHFPETEENAGGKGLKLVNYGSGNICIDYVETTKSRRLTNTTLLKREFEEKLRLYLKQGSDIAPPMPPLPLPKGDDEEGKDASSDGEADEATDPVCSSSSNVPLAEIHAHPKASTIHTVLHSKTQALISQLRKPASSATTSKPTTKPLPSAPPSSRASTLQDRIRAKATAAALAKLSAPSQDQLNRIAARQRIPEIEPILRGLACRGCNITMKNAVEGIKESTRNPISMEEAERVVRLIAEDQDGWVKVVEVGRVTGVVFLRKGNEGQRFE